MYHLDLHLYMIVMYYLCMIFFFQENLEMVVKNGKHKLVGFVDLGKAHDHIESILGEIFIM